MKRRSIIFAAILLLAFNMAALSGCNKNSGIEYTLKYSAGQNGSVVGNVNQTVKHGNDGQTVTAVADSGYKFLRWTDGNLDADRQDIDVKNDFDVLAEFSPDTYTLTHKASKGGVLLVDGEKVESYTQPVIANSNFKGKQITAIANDHYSFVSWSDGETSLSRVDTTINYDTTVIARFKIDSFTAEYYAENGGSVNGSEFVVLSIDRGQQGLSVTAQPNEDAEFLGWSDGKKEATRTDALTESGLSVTAMFRPKAITVTNTQDLTTALNGYRYTSIYLKTDNYALSASDLKLLSGMTVIDLSDAEIAGNILAKDVFGTGNTLLERVELPETLTAISENAFQNYRGLKKIVIPNSVTRISNAKVTSGSTFLNCSSLEYVKLPVNDTYTKIAASTFLGCTALKKVTYDQNATFGVIVNNNIKAFDKKAFNSSGINVVELSSDITTLFESTGDYVFDMCDIYEFIIPENHPKFSADGNILTDKAQAGEKTILRVSAYDNFVVSANYKKIGAYAFANTTLESIGGNSITEIGANAFNGCAQLTYAEFENVANIGAQAFFNCQMLETINAESLSVIGANAFKQCYIMSLNPDENGVSNIPDTCIEIPSNAFAYSGIEKIIIPDTVTSIGTSAFSNCVSLSYIKLPNNITFTQIPNTMFQKCTALKKVTYDETSTDGVIYGRKVKDLGVRSFDGSGIVEAYIASEVTTLNFDDTKASENSSFSGCLVAYFVEKGNSNYIAENGFLMSPNRQTLYSSKTSGNIVLPSTITKIGAFAFSKSKVISITADNVATIGQSAFRECPILKTVTLKKTISNASEITCGTNIFYKSDMIENIFVPSASVTQYKAVSNLSAYSAKIAEIPTVEEGA